MRLLKTETYQLFEENDIPNPFPQYAILSHTWISPKDEITYQDFKQRKSDIDNDIFKQKGWAKLRRYCDRAARDGWEWAWMDTCCIHKTNPADTQEAINAMFRWYQNSGICYAHLDDVDVSRVLDSQDCLGSGQADLDTMRAKTMRRILPALRTWLSRPLWLKPSGLPEVGRCKSFLHPPTSSLWTKDGADSAHARSGRRRLRRRAELTRGT